MDLACGKDRTLVRVYTIILEDIWKKMLIRVLITGLNGFPKYCLCIVELQSLIYRSDSMIVHVWERRSTC
jgi:hypothetical protein